MYSVRGYKFNARLIQFMTSPTISGLVANLVPVKQLSNYVYQAGPRRTIRKNI